MQREEKEKKERVSSINIKFQLPASVQLLNEKHEENMSITVCIVLINRSSIIPVFSPIRFQAKVK